ncbi:MAG: NAD(P)-binding domain-containing protein [Candidatus Krumholzibacteria bacterium]|nr:NAD(P)-binding domain-containing protein [Candidatus Krumholzibacteria bacterium]MDH4337602.1 NAD(P)-binding domain-containing protein [Candidatus Krumholzibacteria bacterium]
MNILHRYTHWLHSRWPAGRVERMPVSNPDGSTNIPGLYVAGDLRGIPLLKFAADSGARVIQTLAADPAFKASRGSGGEVADVAIIGGGVAGAAAALEAKKLGLSTRWFESSEPFSTIVNFPRRKPIFTYPKAMTPAGELKISENIKEALVDELNAQIDNAGLAPEIANVERVRRQGDAFEISLAAAGKARARRVVCALGQSGDFRTLGVPGEHLDKVYNRLHDPADFAGRNVLVVGGGDSAVEAALALSEAGASVTLCYRKDTFSRPKADNLARLQDARGSMRVVMSARVTEIQQDTVQIQTRDGTQRIDNDVVFTMVGREAPLDFFRRAGVKIRGDWTWRTTLAFAGFVAFCVALYNWKSGGALGNLFYQRHWWPVTIADAVGDPNSLIGVIRISASGPSFWYTLAYSLIVVIFGFKRIRRRRTPYVTVQTSVLMAIQVLPLFILPEILLPWLGKNGLLPGGLLDALFPAANYGNGREYWRAYGLILAWPLNVYNVFTAQPLGWWLGISFVQTFVLIPAAIWFWGKGAYCGWVCSCGALAETLGDTQREKMVHGARWNRANMFGQAVLAAAFVLLAVRVYGWMAPGSWADQSFHVALDRYKWIVDVFLAGVVGYGFYFWFSGRVWCRFMCPLAALMHVYARFSRFRISADKKKCISCNVCTSVCHQGIDVMNFANKGLPMQDPECVRCSACVQSCPTGVLTFTRLARDGREIPDRLAASPVRMREG